MTLSENDVEPEAQVFRSAVGFRRRRQPANGERSAGSRIIERALLIFAIMIFCGISTFGQAAPAGSTESNTVNLASNVLILLSFGLLVAINAKTTLVTLSHSHLLLAFVSLALLSVFWSIAPGISIRKFGTLVTGIVVALYMADHLDFSKSLTIISHALLAVVGLSILVAVVRPDLGVTQPAIDQVDELVGTWKGLLSSKNSFGWITIAGAQAYAWRFLVEPRRRWRHAAMLAIFAFAMVKSGSATALVGVALSIVITFALQARQWQSTKRISLEFAIVGLVILAIGILLVDPGDVLGLLGKNATLTGRVPLWHSLLGSIARRPLLGYGYGTFWLNTNPEMIRVWLLNPWQPPDAHDAYLELALSLGIVGASIATLLLVVVTARALSLCKQPHARWAIYVATYLIVYIVTNVDETQIFRGGDLNCFLLAFCYFTVLRAIHGEDVSAAEDRTDRGKEKSSGSRLSQSGRDHPAGRRASPFT